MSPTRLGDPRSPFAIRSFASPDLSAVAASELTSDLLVYAASDAAPGAGATEASDVTFWLAPLFAFHRQTPGYHG